MKKNVGSIDKVVRLLLAALFIVLFVLNVVSGILGYVLLAVAAIFILTSLVNWCPIWAAIGVNTCPAKN
jgi:hypothetical protein